MDYDDDGEARNISPPSSPEPEPERKKAKKTQQPTKKRGNSAFMNQFLVREDEASEDEDDSFVDKRAVEEDDEYVREGDRFYKKVQARREKTDIVKSILGKYVGRDIDDDEDEDDRHGFGRKERRRQQVSVGDDDDAEGMYSDLIPEGDDDDDGDVANDEDLGGEFGYNPGATGFVPKTMAQEIDEEERMPRPTDPHLWRVRCKPGTEQETAIALMRKFFLKKNTSDPLQIVSVVGYKLQRVLNNKSYIYVEAYAKEQVKHAIEGIETLIYGQWQQDLVTREDRPSILRARKPKANVNIGQWVRIKMRGGKIKSLYGGDIGKVYDVLETGKRLQIRVALPPRINFDEAVDGSSTASSHRPPRKVFSTQYLMNHQILDSSVTNSEGMPLYKRDPLTDDGFLIKTIPISSLLLEGVHPTLEESALFEKYKDVAAEYAASSRAAQKGRMSTESSSTVMSDAALLAKYAIGDRVEMVEGDLMHLTGTVVGIDKDEHQVKIKLNVSDHQGAFGDIGDIGDIDVPVRHIRKFFKVNDQVKVVSGRYKDETGLVLHVAESVISLLSDLSQQEIKVKPDQLERTTEVASGKVSLGTFSLLDLVQITSTSKVGCIVRIENERLVILDQNGNDVVVRPQEIRRKRTFRPQARDGSRNIINIGSAVHVIEGEHKGRDGKVVHIFNRSVFIRCPHIQARSGIIALQASNLQVAGASAMKRDNVTSGLLSPSSSTQEKRETIVPMIGRRRRTNPDLHKLVRVIKGPHKGKRGIIKSVNGQNYRIELQAVSKMMTVPIAYTKQMNNEDKPSQQPDTQINHEQHHMSGASTPRFDHADTPSFGDNLYGSETPRYGGDQTPRYSGNETPRLSSGSETPRSAPSQEGETPWNPLVPNTPGTDQPASTRQEWDTFDDDMPIQSPAPTGAARTPGFGDPASVQYGTPLSREASVDSMPNSPSVQARTPMQPYTPLAEAGTPGQQQSAAYSEHRDWLIPRAWVQLPSGEQAVVQSTGGGEMVNVLMPDTRNVVSVAASNLVPMGPKSNDDIYVIRGESQGEAGVYVGNQDNEAIIKLYASGQLKIVPSDDIIRYESEEM